MEGCFTFQWKGGVVFQMRLGLLFEGGWGVVCHGGDIGFNGGTFGKIRWMGRVRPPSCTHPL